MLYPTSNHAAAMRCLTAQLLAAQRSCFMLFGHSKLQNPTKSKTIDKGPATQHNVKQVATLFAVLLYYILSLKHDS